MIAALKSSICNFLHILIRLSSFTVSQDIIQKEMHWILYDTHVIVDVVLTFQVASIKDFYPGDRCSCPMGNHNQL